MRQRNVRRRPAPTRLLRRHLERRPPPRHVQHAARQRRAPRCPAPRVPPLALIHPRPHLRSCLRRARRRADGCSGPERRVRCKRPRRREELQLDRRWRGRGARGRCQRFEREGRGRRDLQAERAGGVLDWGGERRGAWGSRTECCEAVVQHAARYAAGFCGALDAGCRGADAEWAAAVAALRFP